MPDARDDTPHGEGRSPSPGEKRPASEIDTDPEGGVSMDTTEDSSTPNIDDQVAQISMLMQQPPRDGQKGYLISSSWLKKILARSSTHADKADKESLQSELGPVDNSDIILDLGPLKRDFKDEKGDHFVPLRPGLQLSEDYEVVPQEAWDLIMKWYGLADQSPVIVRYAHNTNPEGVENILYELNPPIYTIFKLSNPAAGTTPQVLREKNLPPAKVLAARDTRYMKWLKEAKQLAGIEMASKVRHKSLVLDLSTFSALNESSRERIDIQDQTNNANYNGKMSMSMAGLIGTDVVVLEEQVAGSKGGKWVSEASHQALQRVGLSVEKAEKPEKSKKQLASATAATTSTANSPATSGRSSPVSEIPRGRKKGGRPMGLTGLSNLGNTCYQNAATQCLRAVEELSYYFMSNAHKKELNHNNPLGHKGVLAKSYADLIQSIYVEPTPSSVTPNRFRNTIGRCNPVMSGFEQHDSQEFLMFLLDGLSEDLNRILKKPYIEKPDSTDEMVRNRKALEEFAAKQWDIYKARNDSVVCDLFAGMYKSTLVCPDCHKVSIIFDPFSNLTLPIPEPQIVFKQIVYMALDKPPVAFTVEANKSRPVLDWHKSVATRSARDIDASRLISGDVMGSTFFHVHEEPHVSYDQLGIRQDDKITFMELDSPKEESILIPIFHRKNDVNQYTKRAKRTPFATPTIISITRQESQDLAAIYRKILRHVATMTTRDILNETQPESAQGQQTPEDLDTVVMTEDDAQSVDSRIKTSSVEGEDSIVDVSMQDAAQTPSATTDDTDVADAPPAHPLANVFAPGLLNLFDVRVVPQRPRQSGTIPDGHSLDTAKQYQSLTTRARDVNKSNGSADDNSDEYSDTHGSGSESHGASAWGLVKQGEAIVLDWNDNARDALFGGNKKKDDLRGAATYTDANIEIPRDPEIIARRAQVDSDKAKGTTLDQCLDEFSKVEILGENDAWYCPSCKGFVQASKQFELWSAPDILVVHLKRFGSLRRKLTTKVRFPVTDLDLTDRVTGPEDGRSLKYDLIGVDCHTGGMGGGHYYAHAKNFITGEWCNFNDSFARVIDDPEDVITPQAYLLFYRRQSSEPLGGPELQKIVSKYRKRLDEPDMEISREPSPSGDRQRLGGSPNGSSSGSVGAEATRPSADDESSQSLDTMLAQPSWSFDRTNNSPSYGEATVNDADADLFGDNDSTVAVGDGNSEADTRLGDLSSRPASIQEGSFEDVPPPLLGDDSDDELPVVELRVGEDVKMSTDA
ncbi:hypothetical protein N7448_009823 [Penicillium atrosanguineum]|nr:hypothetical protein N7448_009823 [Penicillium atrosanguineum]